ncbi:phosphoribosylaminoimidazole carboxylase [Apiospora arundinis]
MGVIKTGHAGDPVVTRLLQEDTTPWYKKPNLRLMYVWLFLCCMGVEMTSGFDSQLIGTLQFSDDFNKYFGNGYISPKNKKWGIEPAMLGFISSCYQLGSIIAVPIAPWFNQKYGRRWGIMAGSIIMIIGAILQGFSQHVGMYIVSRMILGVGILFAIVSGSALIGELSHPKERAIMTSLFNSSYYIGSILAAAIAIGTVEIKGDWSWRLPSLLQVVPSVMQICTVFLLPESPRYLVSKDKDDEAFAILTKYHAEGDASSMLVQAEMAQIKSTIKLEMETSKQSWSIMWSTAGNRRRVFVSIFLGLFTQMSGNTLLSYYQSLMFEMMNFTDPRVKTRINIANQCWALMNATVLALFVTRFRRRWAFMASSTSMLLVFTAMTISFQRLQFAKDNGQTNGPASISALFFYFAYSPCYNLGNNALTYTYLVELFPYAIRSRGIGIEQVFGKAGGFFSTNVNPPRSGKHWLEFLFYPETYNRTLEELTFLFEPEELNNQVVAATEKQIHSTEHQHTTTIEEHVAHPKRTEM